MAQKRNCVIEGCNNVATPHTNMCKNCGHGLSYWSHKRPAERVERRRKLEMYSNRLDVVLEGRRKR